MAAPIDSLRASARAHGTSGDARVLRRLRRLCVAVALGSAAVLPFALGVVSTSSLSSLPFIGALYPKPPQGIVAMNNYPRTAVVGHTERFWVRLPSRPNAVLTYILQYPDGHQDRAKVRADDHGYSTHTFQLTGYQPRHFREVAAIGVQDSTGAIQAFLDFAIQQQR